VRADLPGAFPYRGEWAQLIAALEATSRLHRHEPGTLAGQAKYVHQRTGGMIGSLPHLIRGAAIRAILGGQLDVRSCPEVLCAQRRHLALVHHYREQEVQAVIGDAAHAIHGAVRAGAWAPRQRQRLHQLDPGTWPQAAPEPGPGWQCHPSGNPATEIAIYSDVIRLAAQALGAHSASDAAAP
jgi:hypothetical protein